VVGEAFLPPANQPATPPPTQQLITVSADGTALKWDVDSGKQLATLTLK